MDNIPLETTKTCLLAEQAASVSGSSSADLVAATTPPLKQSQDNIDGNEYQDERHSGDGSAMTLPVDIAGNRAVRPRFESFFGCFNLNLFKRYRKTRPYFVYLYDEEELL